MLTLHLYQIMKEQYLKGKEACSITESLMCFGGAWPRHTHDNSKET